MSETDEAPTSKVAEQEQESSTNTHVKVAGLTKRYNSDEDEEVVAVNDITIEVTDGEFLVLVGPSGCGKTTTLRTVAGLETPTEGDIYIDEENVTDHDPRQRDIAMVFQNYALYPHKTVRNNLAFPLEVRGHSNKETSEKVETAAKLLDISELLDRKPKQLSGGQQQRVALGRALVREPSVFLLDEPLSNLDAKLRLQMRTELNELHKRVGNTTIYVTHDQAEAMTLADRVVVMNDGQIQQIGPPQHLYDQPANQFVAGFIGEPPMNFFECRVENQQEKTRLVSDMFQVDLTGGTTQSFKETGYRNEKLILGIRPEDIYDGSNLNDVDQDQYGIFEGYVKVIEPMGSDKFITITALDQKETTSFAEKDTIECTARISPEIEIYEEEVTTFAIDLQKIQLFNSKTGENLLYEALPSSTSEEGVIE